MTSTPRITVVGSVNLDIVATGARLPAPGETITDATLAEHPGGKGANQALAARRLGADVRLIACVGTDAHAEAALALLQRDGVDLSGVLRTRDAPTGVALIAVDKNGANQIIVAPGANRLLSPKAVGLTGADAVICQLETPVETVAAAAAGAPGLFVVNLAPARELPEVILKRADVLVVNEIEARFYGRRLDGLKAMIVTTLGGEGAVMTRNGVEIARARPPRVAPIDTTGAGDCFVAMITVALAQNVDVQTALELACAAGAAATLKPGAQTALPYRAQVDALLAAQ